MREKDKTRELIDLQFQQQQVDISDAPLIEQQFEYISTKQSNKLTKLSLGYTGLNSRSAQILRKGDWQALRYLSIGDNNNFGSQGCKAISKGKWPLLEELHLYENNIDTYGVNHLSKGQWPQLKVLYLQGNNVIGIGGVHWVIRGNWKEMKTMYYSILYNGGNMTQSSMELYCFALSDWPKLESLYSEHRYIPKYDLPRIRVFLAEKFIQSSTISLF